MTKPMFGWMGMFGLCLRCYNSLRFRAGLAFYCASTASSRPAGPITEKAGKRIELFQERMMKNRKCRWSGSFSYLPF
jgi:hypothetical protein